MSRIRSFIYSKLNSIILNNPKNIHIISTLAIIPPRLGSDFMNHESAENYSNFEINLLDS